MLSQSIASSLAVLCAAGLAQADTLSLADIKARNGTQLSEEQLQKLIPGANVVNHAPNGSTRTWTNKPDGSLVASTDSRGRSSTGGTRAHSAEGSWRIENGAYCVKMEWPLARYVIFASSGTIISATMLMILISGFTAGPAVSL